MGVRRGRYRHRDGSKEGEIQTETGVRRRRYRHRDGSKEGEIQTQRWE